MKSCFHFLLFLHSEVMRVVKIGTCGRRGHIYPTQSIPWLLIISWWYHQMETFSALLVTSEFPAQRPVTQSFDVFFDLCLNKWLSKQWWGWWFEMPSHSLWWHPYAGDTRSQDISSRDIDLVLPEYSSLSTRRVIELEWHLFDMGVWYSLDIKSLGHSWLLVNAFQQGLFLPDFPFFSKAWCLDIFLLMGLNS